VLVVEPTNSAAVSYDENAQITQTFGHEGDHTQLFALRRPEELDSAVA
jgi:hypothetical protein